MGRVAAFFHWLGAVCKAPFIGLGKAIVWVVTLPREQMRNFFSLFMLLGIAVLAMTNNFFLFIAKGAMLRGEATWYGALISQLSFNNYLIAWFSGILGLVVFGADYLRAKIQGYELGFGKDGTPAATSETKRLETTTDAAAEAPVSGAGMGAST